MAINITSLFQDILESPEQKQQRQMAEGFARSQNAVSQLTGMARAAAPLVGTMAELQGRRTEDLQRGAGRLLGRDVRSTSEKLQEALGQFNPQDPKSVSQTTQMLQSMGLGAQGAQLAAMALEEQQKSKAMTEEAALRGQQSESNTLAIARAKQVNEETAQASADRSTFRIQAAQAINASDTITASEKQALAAQVAAGGFDGNGAALYEIVSPKPIKVGDQILVKGAGGQWEYVKDTAGAGVTTSLLSSAGLQYANRPEDLAVITDAIASGAITDAKQFKDYAPLPDAAEAFQPGPDIEKYNIAGIEGANTAAQGVNRIDSILTAVYESGALDTAPAGAFSDVVEGSRQFLGIRDTISQIRTAFTGEKNLALLGSMPKGAASDRDVALFAQGFPPDNASMAEMVAWLESAKVAMYRVQDYQAISEKILADQLQGGMAPTTIGLGAKALPVLLDIDFIDSRKAYLDTEIANNRMSREDAAAALNADLQGFYADHQFIPSKYR